MPRSLSKIFASAAEAKASKNKPSAGSRAPELATLKKTLSHHLNPSAPSPPGSGAAAPPKTAKTSPGVSTQVLLRLKEAASKNAKASVYPAADSAAEISRAISSVLRGNDDMPGSCSSPDTNDGMQLKNILDIPWFSSMSHTCITQWRKEVSRERKQKYIFKNTESRRFTKLMRMCASKLGTESTLEFFGKLGRETGIKEYNALIKLCISKARHCNNEEDALLEIHKAYRLFLSMRERGFQIEEESYGPFLMYMIDMKMTQEFQVFSELFKDENPGSYFRIGYYEMLLWIMVGDEDKIRELCNSVGAAGNEDGYSLAESYLLAFCETNKKEELLQLLEVLDISKISSLNYVASIFKSLGRLQLENFAEKFFLVLKNAGAGEENISFFVYDYATSLPHLAVEEVVSKFNNLHEKFGLIPSIASYDKLIALCCNLAKAHVAVDVVNNMCHSGLDVPVESFHPILYACEQYSELELVHPIYSLMRRHKLKPKGDTFKSMISLCVKMKDFEGAYKLLTDAEEMNEMPTTSMYNAIMGGYFREKNNQGALMVLKQMEHADIKPDSETFSYLISNCECEKDVVKYRDEMKHAGVQVTKHIYMALINAYANLGNFERAKQVVLENEVPSKYLNEIKCVLVSALASNGQISDALDVYDEIKRAGCDLEPKAVISLVEHLQTEGALDRLLQLLGELNDSNYWFDGCSRIVLYCVRYNLGGTAVQLLKELKEKDKSSAYIVVDQLLNKAFAGLNATLTVHEVHYKIFSQIWEMVPTNTKIGLELLRAIKEELNLHPSRTSLDFFLSACVKAKDIHSARLIWSEYENVGLSYNVLTFLRMYQALLATGENSEYKAAEEMLQKISKEDPHVRYIIKSCTITYRRKK